MTKESNPLGEPQLSEVHEHFRRVVELLSEDIATDPRDTDALIKRAVAYRILGEFDKAMQDYDLLAVSCALDPTVLHSRGITLLSQGDLGAASRVFDQANESDPWDVESYYRRVATRMALGENSGAIKVFDEFIDTYPRDAFDPGELELMGKEAGAQGA